MYIHLREVLLSGFWLIQNALFGEWWPGARSLPSPTHNLLFLFQMVDKVLPIWGLAVHVTTCLLTKMTLSFPTGQNPLCPPLTVHKPSVQDCVFILPALSSLLCHGSGTESWPLCGFTPSEGKGVSSSCVTDTSSTSGGGRQSRL